MDDSKYLASLESLGLTTTEARAYLVLVEHGVLSAEAVAGEIAVHYPAVYRVLTALEQKGWIEVAQGRPKKYRARNPSMVAGTAKKTAMNDLESAVAQLATLEDRYGARNHKENGDLWIYKGPQAVFNKLREVVLTAEDEILALSPRPIDRSVLARILDILAGGPKPAKVYLHQANRRDASALSAGLRRSIHLEARFPGRPSGSTMLTHTFVFPNEREVFIINTVYRSGGFVEDATMGLWISDADYVRVQLDDMMSHAGH